MCVCVTRPTQRTFFELVLQVFRQAWLQQRPNMHSLNYANKTNKSKIFLQIQPIASSKIEPGVYIKSFIVLV